MFLARTRKRETREIINSGGFLEMIVVEGKEETIIGGESSETERGARRYESEARKSGKEWDRTSGKGGGVSKRGENPITNYPRFGRRCVASFRWIHEREIFA